MALPGSRQDVQDLRDEVMRLLERHRVLTSLASRQQTPRHELLEQMQHRQNLVELQRHLRAQHPADIAVVLDSLSGDDRQLVFGQLDPAQAGAALVESSDAVRASLIENCVGTNSSRRSARSTPTTWRFSRAKFPTT